MTRIEHIESRSGESVPRVIVHETIPGEFLMVRRVIYYLLDIIALLLLVRFILKLLGASAVSGFASFIYAITAPLIAPFRGILPSAAIEGSIIEWSTLIAMIVYAIVAYLLVRLLRLLFR